MFVIDVLAGFVGAFLLFGPAVFAGLQVFPDEPPVRYPEAAATALVGVFLGGLVDVLLGWIPAVGGLLSPLVWVAVVKRFAGTSWLAAIVVGLATWALSALLFAGLPGT